MVTEPHPLTPPKRIQRKRTKGWRMPDGAIYVGRPTKWGNPFRAGLRTPKQVVTRYDEWLLTRPDLLAQIGELRGHDLACFCPLNKPCHADVLLEIANR